MKIGIIEKCKELVHQRFDKNLWAGELLEKAAAEIIKNYPHIEIVFSKEEKEKRAFTEIADDSDHHRIRKGFMCYESIMLAALKNSQWLIGVGEKCGSYPARRFGRDILILKILPDQKVSILDETFKEKVRDLIYGSRYFQNSLVYTYDGELHFVVNPLGEKLKNILLHKIDGAIVEEKNAKKYKPEAVKILASSIVQVLENS